MEEDAGKSAHDQDDTESIDRSEPCRSALALGNCERTRARHKAPRKRIITLTEIRWLLRYQDICDGNMEEGSMRCDANILGTAKRCN